MLELPDVTLCCVDTRSVPQALYAMQRCMSVARFGRAIYLGPSPANLGITPPADLEWVTIPALNGIEDYNRLMLHGLTQYITTSHVLIVQWDGFITHPALWQPDFLAYDYIGAPWYHGGHPGYVGNGGFSLRSKKLLNALEQISPDSTQPEDHEICVNRRSELERNHGIRFAPLSVAQGFSCEYGGYRQSFGFHGMQNFAHVMRPDELLSWMATVPPDILAHRHTRKLIKELMTSQRTSEAWRLLLSRAESMGWSFDHAVLGARIGFHHVVA
ncbi:DUF5672 family protein [Aquabacterium sp.]|uniref:DUF5672 family protein n=1 Tax=Aquabacterium sp. TaxID=1872578 RepID=UPI0035B040A1